MQNKLNEVRSVIREVAPEAEEAIKYRMPTFVLYKNLVHFAAYKNHIGFYPMPSAIKAFKKELALYKSAKGSVQFPIDEPMPLSLIRKMVKFRVNEVQVKTAKKEQKNVRE